MVEVVNNAMALSEETKIATRYLTALQNAKDDVQRIEAAKKLYQ